MIAELAQDLINKVKTVPALANNVGLASAGGPSDPSMSTAPLPSAWLLFESDSVTNTDIRGQLPEDIVFNFTLAVMISYTDQDDLINTQLPTIEAIARSVSGKDSTNFALRWKYQGAQLVDVFTDRLVYELKFMVSATYIV